MYHLLLAKVQAGISITSIIVAYAIAQLPSFDFSSDEITTIVILMIAVGTIWRAFWEKDKSETKILKDQIAQKDEQIDVLSQTVKQLEDHIETLKNGNNK